MPFTQRHKLNIGDGTACDTNPTLSQINLCRTVKCDGCDERCELGYKNCLFKDVIYPTIGTKMIEQYIDCDDTKRHAHIVIKKEESEHAKKLEALNLACKVARLCDKYKTK